MSENADFSFRRLLTIKNFIVFIYALAKVLLFNISIVAFSWALSYDVQCKKNRKYRPLEYVMLYAFATRIFRKVILAILLSHNLLLFRDSSDRIKKKKNEHCAKFMTYIVVYIYYLYELLFTVFKIVYCMNNQPNNTMILQ